MQGLLAGLLVLSVTYFGGKGLLQRFFFRTGYVYAEETERAEELQEYVTQNKLSASDYKMLKKWGTERNIDDFTISRGKWLLFDISYNGKIMYGSREIPNLTWRMYHRISFKDGTADVYIYEGTADKYFNILMVFSVVLGVAVCIGIVVSGMYENVKYIQCLMKEVNIISRGNLQGNVTVQGTDEIAQLASGLEHMRQTLVKKEQIEYDLKSAQEKLVLGMSHDLRTPLTGLMAYLEILKKQQKEGAVTQEYINKAFDRVLQIRDLSEQMFEYFFVNSRHHIELEPAEDIMCAVGDYLSELCALLEYEGFKVNTDRLEWRQISVCINTDFIGRIMNNIISNIEKYGKHENEVCIQLCYGNEEVGISIQNSITRFDSECHSPKDDNRYWDDFRLDIDFKEDFPNVVNIECATTFHYKLNHNNNLLNGNLKCKSLMINSRIDKNLPLIKIQQKTNMTIPLNKKLHFSVYGSYTLDKKRSVILPATSIPYKVGAGFSYEIGKHAIIKSQTNYQYNIIQKKWEWFFGAGVFFTF